MIIKKIENKKNQKLSKLIFDEANINYNQIQKLIRNKDVKVCGKRVSKDVEVCVGDIIELYINETKFEILFEDENIVVAVKPRNIETINEQGDDLKSSLQKQLNLSLFAVHRLDRNTEGLVIFAKNIQAKQSLDAAIKNRKLEKFYYALVVGVPEKQQASLVAYLKKDCGKSLVEISDNPQLGFERIQTNYKLVNVFDDLSLLDVELVTGKTHQIRAHLSHIGYPILGDEKYGNFDFNKKYKKKYQCLFAHKLILRFDENDYLDYLNGKMIEIDKSKIDFIKNI